MDQAKEGSTSPGLEREAAGVKGGPVPDAVAKERVSTVGYPHNPIDGFSNGCLLDLRARLAIEFMTKSPLMAEVARGVLQNARPTPEGQDLNPNDPTRGPHWIAKFALELAGEVLAQSEGRGWVQSLPDYTALEDLLKGHARRTGAFSFMQQVGGGEAQQAMAKEAAANAPRVVPAAPGGIPPAPTRSH